MNIYIYIFNLEPGCDGVDAAGLPAGGAPAAGRQPGRGEEQADRPAAQPAQQATRVHSAQPGHYGPDFDSAAVCSRRSDRLRR